METILPLWWVFLSGAIMGSFLNVCIYRIPRGESIVFPGSHCVSCGRPLPPAELIPIASYVIQQGKCRGCGEAVSIQYPLVEALTGAIFAGLYAFYGGISSDWAAAAAMAAFLIVIAIIDLHHKIIPNAVLLVALLPIAVWLGWKVHGANGDVSIILNSLLGAGFGAALLFAVFWFSNGGLGLGDVKFAFVFGLMLGWPGALWAMTLAALIGSVVGIAGMVAGKWTRKTEVPFGPFLAIGYFAVYLILGSRLGDILYSFLFLQ
ncbi:prepilin peptidase [Heliobacterium undosum]|uniref:Prepilin peptidase n=1 Tax=Heliomicrobium undosum TaxID=121734 RepID=A0A845L1Y7_9FIRM|nr:A24 family peptidase [Heliomicrobium undosum]MZP28490.1 prepilin peptidase [Heliomicrobium undosum]